MSDQPDLPATATVNSITEFRVPLSKMKDYEGKSVGYGRFNGECAAGVQHVFMNEGIIIGLTRTWKPGRKVRGSKIDPGTAIASFRGDRYANDHAAVFIKQDDHGITVWDQFNHPKKPWGKRVLKFETKRKDDYSNDGDYFYTISK